MIWNGVEKMNNRIPILNNHKKICIICEGDEEYDYIIRLSSLDVWDARYDIKAVNARGNGNIPARYQYCYQAGAYDAIFVFCDTDMFPYNQYGDIKQKIELVHGTSKAVSQTIIHANPCTMQIIILHWMDITLKSHKKQDNASIIKKCTGIVSYEAKTTQRKSLFSKINASNYGVMKQHLSNKNKGDTVIGSSNFMTLVNNLENMNDDWIEILNKAI